MKANRTQQLIAAVFAIITWIGVATQYITGYPGYMAKGRSVGGFLLEMSSYFTVQNNFLVACCFTAAAIGAAGNTFFKRPGVLTACAVNISIVALVYNLVLRGAYHPVGWARISDELVHVVLPLLFIVYWLVAVPKRSLTWVSGIAWLIYPVGYLVYILVRGAVSSIYPYFFLDAGKFGYPKVALNIAVLLVVFLVIDMLFIAIAKIFGRYFRA